MSEVIDAVNAQRILKVKEVLGNKIYELQVLVSDRKLEGFEDSEVEGLKNAIKGLNRFLEPLGKRLSEVNLPHGEFAPAQEMGNEGLPILTAQEKGAKAEGLDDELEEVEEEDPHTGTKRTVKRKKAPLSRRR